MLFLSKLQQSTASKSHHNHDCWFLHAWDRYSGSSVRLESSTLLWKIWELIYTAWQRLKVEGFVGGGVKTKCWHPSPHLMQFTSQKQSLLNYPLDLFIFPQVFSHDQWKVVACAYLLFSAGCWIVLTLSILVYPSYNSPVLEHSLFNISSCLHVGFTLISQLKYTGRSDDL